MREAINSYIKKYLSEISELSWGELADYMTVREVIDSLEWLDFIFAVNHEFGITLKPDELKRNITIGELNEIIAEKITEKEVTLS